MDIEEKTHMAALKETCYLNDKEIDDIVSGKLQTNYPDDIERVKCFVKGVEWNKQQPLHVNINTKVSVTLTERGAEVLNKNQAEFLHTIRDFGMGNDYVKECAEKMGYNTEHKKGEVIEEPLWVIMNIFGGNNIEMGIDVPFEKNEIRIIPQ